MKKKDKLSKVSREQVISKKGIIIFLIGISVLALVSFWRVLHFGFWRDDWGFLYAVMYHPELPLAWNLHPATKYEDLIFIHLFGLNTYLWQGFGIFLRIVASASVAAMTWSLTRSKRVAFLSGVFMAAGYAGLESVSWRSVHIISVDIILISLGFYFFFKEIRTKKQTLFALLFFSLAGIADPARCLPVLALVSIWEFLCWWRAGYKIKKIPSYILFIFLLLVCTYSVQFLNPTPFDSKDSFFFVIKSINEHSLVKNFFSTLGNLFLGWMKDIVEVGGLSGYDMYIARFGLAFTAGFSLVGMYLFFIKKLQKGAIIIFLMSWIVLFYLPNWIFEKTLVIGGTHRYIGLSGAGYYVLLAFLISFIRNKKIVIITAILILALNIRASNFILERESSYRNKEVSQMLWNKIENDVPKGETNNIFMYLGGDGIKGFLLDWSGPMPLVLNRGMTDIPSMPIVTSDPVLIVDLLCRENVYRPSLTRWIYQKNKIKISHVHAWEVEQGVIKNVSKRERKNLLDLATKKDCIPLE